jgi:hypothetical protein
MNRIGPDTIDEIFTALDRQIGVHNGELIALVVCGGTALAALGLVSRTTRDVDILGTVLVTESGLTVHRIKEFPQWFTEAASKVGRDFDLPKNWLNLGPASQVDSGLPEEFEKRLIKRRYGSYLMVYFISRLDQIHFKLYAAVDRDDYHVQDLIALMPTENEIEMAAKWVITQDVSEPFRLILKDFLEIQGYGAVAQRI